MAERPWVLVTDGAAGLESQSRTSLWTVRALAAAGYRAAATVSSPYSLAAASRHCRRRVPVPPVDEPGYAEAVRAELTRLPYLTVLPSSDRSLLALGAPVLALVDKSMLPERARAVGIPMPPTEVFDGAGGLLAAANRLPYPVVVKPAFGHGAGRADRPYDLGRWAETQGRLVVQPYLTDGLRSIAGVVWRGRLAAVVHQRFLRTWPPAAGMACAAETVEPDRGLEELMTHLLDGFEGIFQADLAGRYLLDLNPRVYASLSLAMSARANLVGIWCDLLRGREVEFVRGRPRVFYRWLDADLRYAASGLRHGRLSLREALGVRPRFRTARGGPESMADPGPMLARLRYVAAVARSKEEGDGAQVGSGRPSGQRPVSPASDDVA